MDEIRIESGKITIKTDRCPACNSENVKKIGDLLYCRDCEEVFPETYDFENPKDCNYCGYYGDCLERFSFCPFDGSNVNLKLMQSWVVIHDRD